MRTYANFKKYERMLLTVIAKTSRCYHRKEHSLWHIRRQIGAVKQSSRKKHQAIRDWTEELAFFEYPKRSRCQCDHLQHHGNGKGKRAETVRILSAPVGEIATDRQDRSRETKKIPSIFGCPACLLQGTGSRNKQLACTVSAAGKLKCLPVLFYDRQRWNTRKALIYNHFLRSYQKEQFLSRLFAEYAINYPSHSNTYSSKCSYNCQENGYELLSRNIEICIIPNEACKHQQDKQDIYS